jgi:two-component system response regulator DevR
MSEQRIMIVDDHEVVRLGLKDLLTHKAGFEVIAEARTAKEAIEKAEIHQPDVILMDIRLPGASGIEACAAIKQNHPEIKIIMLTSYEEDDMLFSALRAGAETYLLKQIDGQSLIQAIEAVGRDEVLLDPSVTKRVLDEVRRAKRQEELKPSLTSPRRKCRYSTLSQRVKPTGRSHSRCSWVKGPSVIMSATS